jgi:hypothetical protein
MVVRPAPLLAEDPDKGWIDLSGNGFKAWTKLTDDWSVAADAERDPDNRRQLRVKEGSGVFVTTAPGWTPELATRRCFGDVTVQLEFLIPDKSDAGVRLMGLYEVQIADSYMEEPRRGRSCGGILPRMGRLPVLHEIDDGVPPKVNAAKPAGEWQTLEIVFRAPRFDAAGKRKTANAKFLKVVLNGQVIHENVAVATPTGTGWKEPETAAGPLVLVGDRGPVAFRKVRVLVSDPRLSKK